MGHHQTKHAVRRYLPTHYRGLGPAGSQGGAGGPRGDRVIEVFPAHEAYRLSEAENQQTFEELILYEEYRHLRPAAEPTAQFFGGQPGAGKKRPEQLVIAQLSEHDGPETVMPIIGDDFRIYHPQYRWLMDQDDQRASDATAADSARWVERAIVHSLTLGPHVVIEGTLRRPEVTAACARQYQEAGFNAFLHVVAVHEHVSRTRIFERYLQQVRHRGVGRYTPHQAHQVAYQALPASLDTLIASGLFATIQLYDMDGQVIATAPRGDTGA
ncbi:zeta toxin family protein [Actinomyces bowdenii]|uniref:UDP-N-acetylglucosamine kinase n=1 Tax=Actinomyces bowdenii TaxID=131109 RepID=A0A3P1UN27_9ACTO|nr:zeta toxin family protein [Actinomyces bowdenii]RRD23354.1 hypothetical protein EII10_12015 [Actinomyces bowdenii]